jgi:phosphoribosylformylglycinamidine synthase
MLCVCVPENVDAVLEVCARWEVGGTVIGEVTDTREMHILDDGELVGVVPVVPLVDECPLYDLEPAPPSEPLYPAPEATLRGDVGVRDTLLALLAAPNIASRRPVFEQYDCLVGSRTVRRPEQADAAVLAMPTGGAIAVAIDGSGRRVAADPYRGAVEAVLECASNLACAGAQPLGLTNCLNFGNPEKPHIAWQLTEAVRGLGDACRALDVPVVGGNVSLYNEGGGGPIYPTPVVGMVGELPDPLHAGRSGFALPGDQIAIAGAFRPALAASELAKLRGEPLPAELPEIDIAQVAATQRAIRDAVRAGRLSSAHDVAEGGVLVALAESALAGALGADLRLDTDDEATLFGEGPGGFLVSGPADALADLGVPLTVLGEVSADPALEITLPGGERIELLLDELRHAHGALAELFG